MSKVLVTGATGFVGQYVVMACKQAGYTVTPLAGRASNHFGYAALDINASTDWSSYLSDVTAVVHCAARVHVMTDEVNDPLTAYRAINTDGTLQLARQAAEAGVKRFVFISSIKVNGEATEPGRAFTSSVNSAPTDPYALSKYEAEQGLLAIAKESAMEVVIIRPPLVYGPSVKANFASLLKLVQKGLPMPFGAINNTRSLVYIGNLVDLIITTLTHPQAANQVFLVSDDNDVSTTTLLREMANATGSPCYLLPVPSCWLLGLTKLVGKPGIGERLCGNLQLDISETKSCLNWRPPYNLADSLKLTVQHPDN
ncbi:UDP-glucose 4-epimerase family protein [Photobacterium nomapromontoriensis]|uniref:UDP-glucose 4-epimerase family protein n=1 Tax=Photobacterium nomapromontoriensis TaxID=2910237 RepID=UPI003D105F74